MEENLFPSIQSLNSRADLEEERRLFYVALTRAQKRVSISYAENRYRWGNLTICEPSRFIDEIDRKYLEYPQKKPVKINVSNNIATGKIPVPGNRKLKKLNKSVVAGFMDFDSSANEKIQPGIHVEHSRFGKGKGLSIEGAGASKKAAIFFQAVGQKQLLLKYAKLKVID